jgi:hypothetical protein
VSAVLPHISIDHSRLIASQEYVEIVADQLAGLTANSVNGATIEHEADGSCCTRESWPVTLARVLRATAERRAISSLYVPLEVER